LFSALTRVFNAAGISDDRHHVRNDVIRGIRRGEELVNTSATRRRGLRQSGDERKCHLVLAKVVA